jgi:hypothetical protein
MHARRFFISCATTEFCSYRNELRQYLTTATRDVKVQEEFVVGGGTLLEKLDDYIANASAVLHLVGKTAGTKPTPTEVRTILAKYPDFRDDLREIQTDLDPESCPLTYTHWEAFLAIYHRVPCIIFLADDNSVRELGWKFDPVEEAAQGAHRARLMALGRDRLTFPFADARDVAISFYRSYEDEMAGAALDSAITTTAFRWPSVASPVEYPLADRENEFARFLSLITGASTERILLFHGPSDRGKSTLLDEFEKIAAKSVPLRCGRGELKNGASLREVLWNISEDLRPTVRFPRFDRELERQVPESLRTAFLRDLAEAQVPVLLILDTYEQATDEAKRWVEEQLFRRVLRRDSLRIVLAGQSVPQVDARAPWAHVAFRSELPLISDPAHWCRFRKVIGLTEYDDNDVETLVKAAAGSPRLIRTLLSNLQQV